MMIGERISHYKILEKLGEGGMGVVYKAEDLKLERPVALKFLPPNLIASESDKARFVQEAKSASALNHPNVATVYEIDESDGQLFIAMEFVDGVTLREKMNAISFKQAIDIGIQLADGLAAAHEKGIVHRDIKPENIMVRKDGICQIMDFGLAKLRGTKSKVTRLTKEGSTIGTAGYMSPEQVQGQDVDHRSDIFSLGVVLYELMTGELPFKGVHETALLYEIVNVDPVPMAAMKPEVDPMLDGIVLECLAKEPAERYQSVAEVAKELRRFKRESTKQRVSRVTATRAAYAPSGLRDAPPVSPVSVPPTARPDKLRIVWMALAVVSLALAGTFGYLYFKGQPRHEVMNMFAVSPPVRQAFESPVPAISPDGRTIAFTVRDTTGRSLLWIRPLSSIAAKPLEGTEDATLPFWSPDSRFIAFFASGKLKKIAIAGGSPQTICNVGDARGGSWSNNGTIVFAPDYSVGLSVVPATGGVPTKVTSLDTVQHDDTHRFSSFLPDGRRFVYFRRAGEEGKTGIYLHSLDGNDDRFLFQSQSNATYVSPGFLLFLREKSLVAQPFDPSKGEVKGDAIQLFDNVGSLTNIALGAFSASENGVLVFMEGVSGTRELSWYDSTGKVLKHTAVTGAIFDFRLSPDEQTVVFRRIDPQTHNQDLWLYDMSRSTQSRFTFDAAIDDDPVWSPDGSQIIYDSNPEVARNLYRKASTGAGNPELLLKSSQDKAPEDWSHDGSYVLYEMDDPSTKADLWVLPLAGDKKPFPYLNSTFQELDGRFSPDVQWVVYSSDESGRFEVYIQHFPPSGGKWQVSANGGSAPEWSKDGKEIYFLSPNRKLMVVDVHTAGSAIQVGIPSELFEANVDVYNAPNRYDVSADGRSFLVNTSSFEYNVQPMTVVLNWPTLLVKQ